MIPVSISLVAIHALTFWTISIALPFLKHYFGDWTRLRPRVESLLIWAKSPKIMSDRICFLLDDGGTVQSPKHVLNKGRVMGIVLLYLSILLHLFNLYAPFSHKSNPSFKIKKFHSSTSRHVSAAKGHHHVSYYAKTVALYKI
jgi:hypothetical protein